MITYINYANVNFRKQQKFALKAAQYIGGFDKVIGYTVNDIDKGFALRYQNILSQVRGGGYWLWKPYFIQRSLKKMSIGDYLFYSDSGAFFLKSVVPLVEVLENSNKDIMAFELPLIEEQWSKKELIRNMGCDEDLYLKSNQISASFILIKKTEQSEKFVEEYLAYSCQELNLTDIYDVNVEQDANFIEHRHDQSVFSLLYKRYGYEAFKDPTQHGKCPRNYADSDESVEEARKLYILKSGRMFRFFRYEQTYEMILFHNRSGRPLIGLVKFIMKNLLVKLGIGSRYYY
jgi:hypothetical protein